MFVSKDVDLVSSQVIHSAPYPGPAACAGEESVDVPQNTFHEWNLEKAGDILEVFLLIRNIDCWTVGPFLTRVKEGVESLEKSVLGDHKRYAPWKRVGKLTVKKAILKENKYDANRESLGSHTQSQPSSAEVAKPRRRTTRNRTKGTA